MLKDIYEPIDPISDKYLDDAELLLDSDLFLAGLGKLSNEICIPKKMNVIRDFERAEYLMNSQEMWNDSSQENGDQFFSDILNEAVCCHGQQKYALEEAKRRREPLNKDTQEFDNYIISKVNIAYDRHTVRDVLGFKFTNANSEGVQKHLDINYPGIISSCIYSYIRAGYFEGIDDWPIGKALMNILAIGGVPTGWVGPFPEDDGSAAEDCLQIIHFGPKSSN